MLATIVSVCLTRIMLCCVDLIRNRFVIHVPCNSEAHASAWYIYTVWHSSGAFAKFRKATVSFVMSDCVFCLSVRLTGRMEQLDSHWTDFHEIWYLSIFRKYVGIIKISLTSSKNNGYFTWRPIYIFFIVSRSILLRMKNISHKSCGVNHNMYFVYGDIYQRSCRLWDNVGKYCGVGQVTGDNIIPRMCFVYRGNKAKNTYSEFSFLYRARK